MKYRKKPVVIEAVLWDGNNIEEIIDFVGNKIVCFITEEGNRLGVEGFKALSDLGYSISLNYIQIDTLEGLITASKYDFIIKGVNGEFYPCKPDIFAKTYEKVEGE